MEELQAQPQANQQEATPQMIKVKYNHEEYELPLDEATTLIQKGMNYDKIYEKYDNISKSKALKILSERAEKMGITADELAEKMDKNLVDGEIKELAEEKGYSEDDARLIMEAQQLKAGEAKRKQEESQKAEREQWINDQIDKFSSDYPDINIEKDLPGKVVDLWLNQNIPLIVAYKAYLADNMPETKKEIKEMQEEVNKETAAASMGDVKSQGDSEPTEFTHESVQNMTSEQRRKYMPQILEAIRSGKLQA